MNKNTNKTMNKKMDKKKKRRIIIGVGIGFGIAAVISGVVIWCKCNKHRKSMSIEGIIDRYGCSSFLPQEETAKCSLQEIVSKDVEQRLKSNLDFKYDKEITAYHSSDSTTVVDVKIDCTEYPDCPDDWSERFEDTIKETVSEWGGSYCWMDSIISICIPDDEVDDCYKNTNN